MKRILLLSDTHNYLDNRIFNHLKECDEIWHAGDIGSIRIIDQLKEFAEIKAVYGNIDGGEIRKELNKILFFKCEEMKIMITHIGGYPGKYQKDIKEIILNKKPDIFISGHSHILKVIHDKDLNLLHMNPGAIGNYGIHKVKTILTFNIQKKKIKDLKVIEYPR